MASKFESHKFRDCLCAPHIKIIAFCECLCTEKKSIFVSVCAPNIKKYFRECLCFEYKKIIFVSVCAPSIRNYFRECLCRI
jgi:hypothetical protein